MLFFPFVEIPNIAKKKKMQQINRLSVKDVETVFVINLSLIFPRTIASYAEAFSVVTQECCVTTLNACVRYTNQEKETDKQENKLPAVFSGSDSHTDL